MFQARDLNNLNSRIFSICFLANNSGLFAGLLKKKKRKPLIKYVWWSYGKYKKRVHRKVREETVFIEKRLQSGILKKV